MFSGFFFVRGRGITIFSWCLIVFLLFELFTLEFTFIFEQWAILLHMTCFITIKIFKLILLQELSKFSWKYCHLLFIVIWITISEDAWKASSFFFKKGYCSSFFLSSTCTSYAIKLPMRFSNDIVERSFVSSIAVVFFSQSDVSARRILRTFSTWVHSFQEMLSNWLCRWTL